MASESPDSVPSLAELSQISHDESAEEPDSVSKQLFPPQSSTKTNESQRWQSMIVDIVLPCEPAVPYQPAGDGVLESVIGVDDNSSVDFCGYVLPNISSMIASSTRSKNDSVKIKKNVTSTLSAVLKDPPIPAK